MLHSIIKGGCRVNEIDEDSKEYQKYVKDYTINRIQKTFKIKTKKEAEQYFWKALAYNLVQNELIDKICDLIEEEKMIK
jgi:DNA-binding ferritin-like protein (Dps family)